MHWLPMADAHCLPPVPSFLPLPEHGSEAEIRAAIEQVHRPLFQTYLRMRFLGYRTEPQIAAETGYSLEHIHGYIRRGALDSVQFSKINPK